MTYFEMDPTLVAPEDLPPMSSEEAAEIARIDEALNEAGSDPDEDEDQESSS
ncbi:MAG TPA: hypothetical protein VGQ92_19205 [Actinoplanes sp.]|nr:hypothetical protein [Actinoplanes sp.]